MMRILSWKWSKGLAFLTAGLLLFAQHVSATQVCMLVPDRAGTASAEQMSDGCDATPMGPVNCSAHCQHADQSATSGADKLQFVAPVAYTSLAVPSVARIHPPQRASASRLPGGPPLRVLFCSYQI